jgi:uncharacterized protein YeaO (DUF488 family)
MVGRLRLCSLRRPRPAGCDRYFAAVRLWKGELRGSGWDHVPQLAPPLWLLRRFLAHRAQGEWPARWDEYAREFGAIMSGEAMRGHLDCLGRMLEQGQTIALGCYCTDGCHCHRRLIGEEMARRGFAVKEVGK